MPALAHCPPTHACTHTHPLSSLRGAPRRPDPSAFYPIITTSTALSPHRRQQVNLRKESLRGGPISLLVHPEWGPQAVGSPGCSNPGALRGGSPDQGPGPTTALPQPLGSGPVPPAPTWSLAPSLQASASPCPPRPGPRQTLPSAEQLRLTEQKGCLCFPSQAELATSGG